MTLTKESLENLTPEERIAVAKAALERVRVTESPFDNGRVAERARILEMIRVRVDKHCEGGSPQVCDELRDLVLEIEVTPAPIRIETVINYAVLKEAFATAALPGDPEAKKKSPK